MDEVTKARIMALEARDIALTNLVVFLTTQQARMFDNPEMIITALSEAIRESAEGYDADDPETHPGHKALIDWADDFEERVLEQL